MAAESAYTYDKTGGGANYLCLPLHPEYLLFVPGIQDHRGYIFGLEYEIFVKGPLKPLDFKRVPCAVCLTYTCGMIPGKISCPHDWTHEYHGYLMCERYTHNSPSIFECIDKDAEGIGNTTNTYGGICMPAESRCGSDICPPYEDGKELACVICTI